MWATFPNIAEAIKVLEAWGFVYKTAAFVWIKKNRKNGGNFWGMGAYTRANAEVCLLGVSQGLKARERVRSHRVHQVIEAPASTRHHGAHPGGLLDHSLNVYHRLRAIVCVETYGTTTSDLLAEDVEETVAVLALLHDVCKVNCYHTETRRRKNPETGYWEDYQTYAFRDPLPLGHGEKSLYLIQRHMDLEPEEALAIRWHMGAYDNAAKGDGRALSAAMAASPWVWRLQQADMCAAWVDEREAAEE